MIRLVSRKKNDMISAMENEKLRTHKYYWQWVHKGRQVFFENFNKVKWAEQSETKVQWLFQDRHQC